MSVSVGRCWNCGKALSDFDLGREARCPGCSKAVHCCRNCRYYQPGRSNDCMEPVADFVADKINANFCDYLQTHDGAYRDKPASTGDLKDAAEDLFK